MDEALYRDHAELESKHWWFLGRRRIVHSVLMRHVGGQGASLEVLDVGFGTGGMLSMLSEFGSLTGLEVDGGAAAHARARTGLGARLRTGSIPQDIPGGHSYDLVTAFDVIEHLDDDLSALQRLTQALSPGGTLVITVPAYQWLWGNHDDLNHHKRRYTRRRLLTVLRGAGLDVRFISYFNFWLLPIVAAIRLLPLRRGGTDSSDFSMPPAFLNSVLTRLFASERHILGRVSVPAGVSIVAVCRRQPQAPAKTAE